MAPSTSDMLRLGQFNKEESVGYLLGRARMLLAKSLDAELAGHDITHAQGSIVLMLATGKYATATDLARELYIDSASMTRMIDRLEKRGLISRIRSADDRRIINLLLTSDGETLAAQLPDIYTTVLNRRFAGFSLEELATLKFLLRKLLATDMSGHDADMNDTST